MKNPFFEQIRKYTSIMLLELRCVLFKREDEEPFKYKSGNRGNVYVDCRKLISYNEFKKIISGYMANIIQYDIDECITGIVGGETAGMSFGEQLADLIGKPYFYVRKKQKKHGFENMVVGDPDKMKGRVVLIEDLITNGSSKETFLNNIWSARLICKDCIVILDREQGGEVNLKSMDVKLHSLTTLRYTLDTGLMTKMIDEKTYKSVIGYLNDPKEWSLSRGYEWNE